VSLSDQVDQIFAHWNRHDRPGCAVGVLREGEIVHAKGYGMADLEHGVPITSETIFHVASLSKQVTGFAVLLLAREGKLSLDDDIRKYVPEVPNFGKRITLRHLLHHTSGLRDHFTVLRLAGWRYMDEKTEADILQMMRRQRELNFRPGEEFIYCNTGYVLLAVTVQRISGTSFREFTRRHIFEPLQMGATRFRDDHTELVKGRAYGYVPRDGGFGFGVPNFDIVGSTSLHTTAGDLLRWARNLMEGRVGGLALVEQLRAPGTLRDGCSVRYGAGVQIGSYRGLEVVKHSGWDLGYTSHLAVYPSERFAVAILSNLKSLGPWVLARRVADIYLADCFPEQRPQPADVPEAALKTKVGLYRHPRTGRAQWVHLSQGVLRVASGGAADAPGLALTSLDDTRFLGIDETTEVILDGATMTVREEHGVAQVFKRAKPWKAGALAEYAGTYRSPELDTTLTFVAADGRLAVEERKAPRLPVSAAYRDAFASTATTYIFTRNRRGAIDGVALSAERIVRLRFDRVAVRAPRLSSSRGRVRGRRRRPARNR